MATPQISTIIQHLRRAALAQDATGMTDGQLLESFIAKRDEAAFESLLRRHGSMVLGVCYRILRNHHDAEDAFQATFLVFARKASSVRPRERIANWLHGVAHRTALKARTMKAKSQVREGHVSLAPEPVSRENDRWNDLQPVLDEELARLPENFRLPLLLCDLEGKSIKEATRQLGWPQGTLAGRLARARKMLAKRLTQRGIGLSGGGLAAVLSEQAASACVPPPLAAATIKAAVALAAGQTAATAIISANVAALTEGMLKAMMLTKLKTVTAFLLMLGVVASGGGMLARHTAAAQQRADDGTQPAKFEDKQNAFRLEVVPGALVERYAVAFQEAKAPQAPRRKAETPKTLDETLLHGVWMGKEGENDNFVFIFGPNNAIRYLTEKGRDSTGTYSVDWSKKPHRLDLKWGKGPTSQTIMEFTQDGKLRIEFGVVVLTKVLAAGGKLAEAAASKDLRVAEFYHKTGHFASAYFYSELVKRRYPDTEFAKKATQLIVEVNKHRIRRLDGSEGWEEPEPAPQKPQALPTPVPVDETPVSGPRTVVLENAKLVIEESAKMRLSSVKTAKGPCVRLEITGELSTITVESPKIRIESKTQITQVEATKEGTLNSRYVNFRQDQVPRVGDIIIVGNKKTADATILKELALYPGQLLDDETVRAAEKKLSAFDATLTIKKPTDGTFAYIVISVNEK